MKQIKIMVFEEEIFLEFKKTQYAFNGGLAIRAYDAKNWEEFKTLSVNLPSNQDLLEENEFFFDDNNDYFGIKNIMIDEKLIIETGKVGRSGFCTYPVCRLLIELPKDI